MYNIFKFFFLLPLLIYCSLLYAQGTATVVSAKTGEPIPYATIKILHSGKGAYTNESGQFKLLFVSGDTLLVTSIGYKPTLFVMTDKYISEFPVVPTAEELEKITINNKKLYRKHALGNLHLKIDGYWYSFAKGEQVAQRIYFPLESDNLFKIKKVIIPIELGKTSIPIVLHIYGATGKSGLPGEELLTNTYLIGKKNTRGNKAVINLEKENLWVNDSSVFICIEGLPPPMYNTRYSGDIKLPLSYKLTDTLTLIKGFFTAESRWSPHLQGKVGGLDMKLINTLFNIEVEEYR